MRIVKINNLLDNPIFWGIVIFITAGFFRLLFLDLMEFHKPDPALNSFEITQFYRQPYLITRSNAPITPGFYYSPLSHYILLLLALPSRDPIVITFMIALLNTVAITFFYSWARKFYGNMVAVIASLFLSLSPWSILLSRSIYVPDLLLPFSILFLYFFHKVILKKDKKSAIWLGFSASLLIQMHPPGLFLVFAAFISLFLQKIHLNFRKFFLGFVVALVFALPYFISLIKPTPQSPWVVFIQPSLRFSKNFELAHFLYPFQFISGFGLDSYIGKRWSEINEMFPYMAFINWFLLLEIVFPLIAFLYIFKRKSSFRFLALIIVIISFLLFISKSYLNMYYHSVVSPIVAILSALSAIYLGKLFPKISGKLILLFFSLVFLLHIIFEASLYFFMHKSENVGGLYGEWIFRKTKAFVDKNTHQYSNREDYDIVRAVAYVYSSQTDVYNQRMGEYFAQTGEPYLAMDEYKKQLDIDPNSIQALTNLIYIRILTRDLLQAEKELKVLEVLNTTASADLKRILEQARGTGEDQEEKMK